MHFYWLTQYSVTSLAQRWQRLLRQVLLVLAVGLVPRAAVGTLVETDQANNTAAYAVSSADLLQGLTGALSGTTTSDHSSGGAGGEVTCLTNGTNTSALDPYPLNGSTGQLWKSIDSGVVLTYSLGAAYNISSIDTYTFWVNSGRVNQNYTVLVSTDNGATYTSLQTVSYNISALALSGNQWGHVALTDTTGIVATGVTNIRFTFAGQQNGWVGFSEIDVQGTLTPAVVSRTWLGNNSGNWNTAANWVGGVVPGNGDSVVFGAAGNAGNILNDDIPAGLTLGTSGNTAIAFSAGASAFTIGGSTANPQINLSGSVTNASTNRETIYLNTNYNGGRDYTYTTTTGGGDFVLGGALSGLGTGNSIVASGAGTLYLTNPNNSFTGRLQVNSGAVLNVAGLNDYNTNGVLGNRSQAAGSDAAGGVMGLILNGGTLQYTGAAAQSSNRMFRLGGVSAIDASGSTPAATVNFTATSSNNLHATASSKTLTFTGTNTGNNVFASLLSDFDANDPTSVLKTGAGTWDLTSSASTYTGYTQIVGGILNVASVSNYGQPSAIGARLQTSDVASGNGIGLWFQGGTLQYTGSTAQSTNRQIRMLNTTSTIDASGSTPAATLSFTASGTNVNLFDTGGTRALVLTGSNTGANSFSIKLEDQGTNATSLTKSGAGTWVLGGTQTFSGTATVSAGTLVVDAAHTAPVYSATDTGKYLVNYGATLAGTGTIKPAISTAYTGDAMIIVSGALAPGDPTAASGVGTLTFDGSNAANSLLSFTANGVLQITLGSSGSTSTASKVAIANGQASDVVFNNNLVSFTDATNGGMAAGQYVLIQSDAASAFSGLTLDSNGFVTAGLQTGTGLGQYPGSTLQVVGNNLVLNLAAFAARPNVLTASASSTRVWPGGSTTLTYNIAGATSVTVNQGIGAVPASGTLTLNPTATTTYTFTATNANGTTTYSVTVVVIPKPVDIDTVYQYSVPMRPIFASQAGTYWPYESSRRAYLWIPPNTTLLNGVLVSVYNIMEEHMLQDAGLRAACAQANLGIVYVLGGPKPNTPDSGGFPVPGFASTCIGGLPSEYASLDISATLNITSASAANPTVITTSAAHGLNTGDIVTIAGNSNSAVNGNFVVTTTSTTTFTISVNVSTAGTGGTAGRHYNTDINPATGTRFTNENAQCAAELGAVLDQLAVESGHNELHYAPVALTAHSAASTFAWQGDIHTYPPLLGRTFALMPVKGTYRANGGTFHGMPVFHMGSEWGEVGGANWGQNWDSPDNALMQAIRGSSSLNVSTDDDILAGQFIDFGAGHYRWNEDAGPVLGMFLRKAIAARLPSSWDGTKLVTLNTITPSSGYLLDSNLAANGGTFGTTAMVPQSYADYAAAGKKTTTGYWYLDQEMAQTVANYITSRIGLQPQMIDGLKNGVPYLPQPNSGGTSGDNATTGTGGLDYLDPVFQADNASFPIDMTFLTQSPTPKLFAGLALGHSTSTPTIFDQQVGAIRQVGLGIFKVWMVRGSALGYARPIAIAYNHGDTQYRSADRPVQFNNTTTDNLKGAAQTITFSSVPNQLATSLHSISLNATASSGLPVQYFVVSGPFAINDYVDNTTLIPQTIPPGTAFPMRVIVGAYQWGTPIGTGVQTALPVYRTFWIHKNALEAWRYQNFGILTTAANGDQYYSLPSYAADNADPDGDGIVNLLEYALGTSPLVANPGPSYTQGVTADRTRLTLTFNRVADAAITYTVEATNDLTGTWAAIWSSTGASNVPGSVTVTDTEAIGTHPQRFLRLRISY